MSILDWLKRLLGVTTPAASGSAAWKQEQIQVQERALARLQIEQREVREERHRVAVRLDEEEQKVAVGGLSTELRDDALSNVRRLRDELSGLKAKLQRLDDDIEMRTRIVSKLHLLSAGSVERPSDESIDSLTEMLKDEQRLRRETTAAERDQHTSLELEDHGARARSNDQLEREIRQKHTAVETTRVTESE